MFQGKFSRFRDRKSRFWGKFCEDLGVENDASEKKSRHREKSPETPKILPKTSISDPKTSKTCRKTSRKSEK